VQSRDGLGVGVLSTLFKGGYHKQHAMASLPIVSDGCYVGPSNLDLKRVDELQK
jgi:hypothetical protein